MDNNVFKIIETLNKNGFEAYIVGGCVRDMLLGLTPKDYDITTAASPDEIKNLFAKTIDTGIEHGTVTVVLNKTNYEVTTFRLDGKYSDNRRPDNVTFTRNLNEDLLRRDFTINAIAYHKDIGYIDPFGGILDIEKKLLKGVGDPDKRFKEDALRMLRAVRFSAKLNFTIDEKTLDAIKQNNSLLRNISMERIRDEIVKTIMAEHTEKLHLLEQTGLMDYILPKFKNLDFIVKALKASPYCLTTRLTLFFQFIDDIKNTLKYFKFDNNTIKDVTTLVKYLNTPLEADNYFLSKLINKVGRQMFIKLVELQKIIAVVNENQIYNKTLDDVLTIYDNIKANPFFISDLKIDGNDLKNLGVKQGTDVGVVLNQLLDLVLNDATANDAEILKNLALEIKEKLD